MSSPRTAGARSGRPAHLERLTRCRLAAGWTQEAVAAVMRVSPRAVYRREAGVVGLRVEDLAELAAVYEISDDELVRIVQAATPTQVETRLQAWRRR